MAYTVKKLAEISGVSVRTLHFYDEAGLLKPAYYGSNGYRYYEEKQLLLLQQILFYRELGLEIKRIQKILGRSDFDILAALLSHREVLQKDLERSKKAIETIDKTINHLKGIKKMKEEEMFYGLETPKQKEYVQYLFETGMLPEKEMAKSREMVEHWTQEDWSRFAAEGDKLWKEVVSEMLKGSAAGSPGVQTQMRKLYEGYCNFWTPSRKTFCGLADFYQEVAGQKVFESYHPKLLFFAVEAMKIFAERELS